ncbi:MAG: hypothetical protein JWR19_3455 [Pedosphaera sp.]|nr:hypothetical protein [Pedosphaera sp.]
MKENENAIAPLSPLEISGAISARVIHELSSLISGIVGNAEYAGTANGNPADLQKAIQAISVSANSAGKLLGQCLPLQQAVHNQTFPFDISEQTDIIAQAAGLAPGWRATLPATALTGQVKVQPRWLTAAVWQIARETQATRGGEVHFASGPAAFPIVWHGPNPNPGRPLHLFQITLAYRSDQMLVSDETPVTPERPALLAAFEIIRRFKGQLQSRPKPPGRQEISILIPLL